MFLPGFGKDQNIVQVNDNELPDIRLENGVHYSLKRGRGIGETFDQNFELEMTHRGTESRFRDVFF